MMKEDIPKKPPTMLPKQRVTATAGRVMKEARALDQKYFTDVTKFCEKSDMIRRELERKERSSSTQYSMMQPELKPSIKDLRKDKEKIDVMCELFV